MTIPHYCYDQGDDLPQFLIGKSAGNGNRTHFLRFRKTARFRRKLAAISALSVLIENGHVAGSRRITRFPCPILSDFFPA
jgi:hypothetical protein